MDSLGRLLETPLPQQRVAGDGGLCGGDGGGMEAEDWRPMTVVGKQRKEEKLKDL